MTTTRRKLFWLATGAVLTPFSVGTVFAAPDVSDAIAEFTRGNTSAEGDMQLEVPEIADNGGAVPVHVSVEGARRIAILADANPNPEVAEFSFGSHAVPEVTVRIRLAESQNVIAVAEMADGTFREARQWVIVTVGGCA